MALDAACREAARRQAPLHLVHVLDVGAYALGDPPDDLPPYLRGASSIALDGLDDVQAEANRRLQVAAEKCGGDAQVAVVAGHAAPALVSYAESVEAALIVVGTQGRSRFARLTLGSTAAGVVESAPCSVLVVRASQAAVPS